MHVHSVFFLAFFDGTSKFYKFKGALSGLRQFLANESPLKILKMRFISR